jgi:hypothetical protein
MTTGRPRKAKRDDVTEQILSLLSTFGASRNTQAPTDDSRLAREAIEVAKSAQAQLDKVTAWLDEAMQDIERMKADAKVNYETFRRMRLADAKRFLRERATRQRQLDQLAAARRNSADSRQLSNPLID